MWFGKLAQPWLGGARGARQNRSSRNRKSTFRPTLTCLEDRMLLTSYTASAVLGGVNVGLIADINASNGTGISNTITLVPTAGQTLFTLTGVNNTTFGPTGLPVITGQMLTISGQDGEIVRSTATGTPPFRLLAVDSTASLTLKNLFLGNGLAFGAGVAAEGGAIFSEGPLTLNNVTVRSNQAKGSSGGAGGGGGSAAGGGLFVSSPTGSLLTLAIKASLFEHNHAIGGNGGPGTFSSPAGGAGGSASGGAIAALGAATTLSQTTLVEYNGATAGNGGSGGPGGAGGTASGGGLYQVGGSLLLNNSAVKHDTLFSGFGGFAVTGSVTANGGNAGGAFGAGLYLSNVTTTLKNSTIQANNSSCGIGGGGATNSAGNGGSGGFGGNAVGGGIDVSGGTVTEVGSLVVYGNGIIGANGGPGGPGINGGPGSGGGAADGGGIAATGATVTLNSSTGNAFIYSNVATGGFGGLGGPAAPSGGGVGGNGGNSGGASGGGMYVSGTTLTFKNSIVEENQVFSGNAGSGGSGPTPGIPGIGLQGSGGGVSMVNSGGTLMADQIYNCTALGGYGLVGGDALGGGLYIALISGSASFVVNVNACTVQDCIATGGAGAPPFADGNGDGGGIAIVALSKMGGTLTVNLTSDNISLCNAQSAGSSGNGLGGGLYMFDMTPASLTVHVHTSSISQNNATGPAPDGGGIFGTTESPVTFTIDALSVIQTTDNYDVTGGVPTVDNIS